MFSYPKSPIFPELVIKVWKKSPNFGPSHGNVKNRDFQASSEIELFSFKLAGTELTKSRVPRFKGWVNHVFLSKISNILRISHKSLKKSPVFGPNHGNVKNRDFQVSSKIELFTLKLAVSKLTKSMFPWFKGWVNHVFLSKISHFLRIGC